VETLLNQYGYLVIFIVTLFEGETILLIAGILASQGILNIELSILSAFLGSTIGDQMYFHFAKHEGERFVKRFKYIVNILPRAEKFVKRHGAYAVIFSRYLYGIRLPLVITCGLVKMSSIKFSIYNASSALIWAVSYGFLGYFFAEAFGLIVGIKKLEFALATTIAIAAIIYWILRTAKSRKTPVNDSRQVESSLNSSNGSPSDKPIAEEPNSADNANKQEE